jgi:3-oxoacyl-[acyl-carrier-protein] synthase-3
VKVHLPYDFGFEINEAASCDFSQMQAMTNEAVCSVAREGECDERLIGFIAKKMGIQNRYYVEKERNALDLAREALKSLVEKDPSIVKEADFFIFGCISSPMPTTCVSSFLASEVGMDQLSCFDLKSGCSTGVLALQMALDFFHKGAKRGVIVCSETLSKFANPEFLQMSAATGDGAAAISLTKSMDWKVSGMVHGTDPHLMKSMYVPGTFPIDQENYKAEDYFFHFATKTDAIEKMGYYWQHSLKELLEVSKLSGEDVNHYIAHQVDGSKNVAFAKSQNIPDSAIAQNFKTFGNMGCPTVLLNYKAWSERDEHGFKKGDHLIFHAVGGGLSWAGIAMERING